MKMFAFARWILVVVLFCSCSLQPWASPKAKGGVIIRDGRALVADSAPDYVKKAVAAANRIAGKPYKWGGGRGAGVDSGYDCSGATSYVLREAGLLNGSLTSSGFVDYGKRGKGPWITVWARKGHVFLTIGGVRFDAMGDDSHGGPQWFTDERSKKKFQARKPEF